MYFDTHLLTATSKDPDRNQRVLASQSTMPDASTSASASGLLDLPAELREHIYLFATADVDQLRTTYPGSSETVVIPPLAQTSHQLRAEVLASLFRCSTLIVTLQNEADAEVARTWLVRWQERGARFRHVEFHGPGRYGEPQPVDRPTWPRARKYLSEQCKVNVRSVARAVGGYEVAATWTWPVWSKYRDDEAEALDLCQIHEVVDSTLQGRIREKRVYLDAEDVQAVADDMMDAMKKVARKRAKKT